MTVDRSAFVDDSGETRFAGTIQPGPGTSAGDTLQSTGVDGEAAEWAAGGGSQPGVGIVRGPFAVAFDDAGLAAGKAFYSPTTGDVLLDAWVEFDTAWDGTTPKLDIGTFVASGNNAGLFHFCTDALDATSLDDESAGTGTLIGGVESSLAAASGTGTVRAAPLRFTAANPLKVVVSQDGAAGGASPGSTQGAARIYIVTATPTT